METTVSPLPGTSSSSMTAKYKIRDIHFFTILETNIGLTLMWDRGTRLYVTLDPKFKGNKSKIASVHGKATLNNLFFVKQVLQTQQNELSIKFVFGI